jgi:hypothetical protein
VGVGVSEDGETAGEGVTEGEPCVLRDPCAVGGRLDVQPASNATAEHHTRRDRSFDNLMLLG